ncbi:MAG: 30S ribosomal protein S6e [Candidatus Aenigmarchaeota archaeon]|nr:30S ribosomal protein S6e [Candidatus Aenigmarchaeota archaeon]
MPVFKFIISCKDKSFQIEKDQNECNAVIGKAIGDKFSADFLGMEGYELQITGGSDKDGFPMIKDIIGITRKKILVVKGDGFRTVIHGKRRRKSLRGNTIANDIVQINCKVVKEGTKTIEDVMPKKSDKDDKQEANNSKEH